MNLIDSDCDYCSIIKASAKPKPKHSDDNLFSDRTVVLLYSSAKYDDEASFIVTFYVTQTANDDLLPDVVDDDPF